MDKRKRFQFLLEQKRRTMDRLLRAQKIMGEGIWHEDSSYEFANSEIRVYQAVLEDLEKEIKELEKDLKAKDRGL